MVITHSSSGGFLLDFVEGAPAQVFLFLHITSDFFWMQVACHQLACMTKFIVFNPVVVHPNLVFGQ
jgi:hypothetical protein